MKHLDRNIEACEGDIKNKLNELQYLDNVNGTGES